MGSVVLSVGFKHFTGADWVHKFGTTYLLVALERTKGNARHKFFVGHFRKF